MDFSLIEKIINDLTENLDHMYTIIPVKLSEPFLDTRLEKILQLVSDKLPKATVYIPTNGSLLTPEKLIMVSKYNLKMICVSLNFFDKDNYEKNMCLDFENIIKNLHECDELYSLNKFQFPIQLSRVCDGTEYDNKFEDYVKKNFRNFSPWLKGRGNWLGNIENPIEDKHICSKKCGQYTNISITSTGDVSFCCMDGEAEYVYGNVKYENAIDIFNKEERKQLRSGQISRSQIVPCINCTY